MNEERRQCIRRGLIMNLPVRDMRTNKRCGYLLDITPVGFQLVGEKSFSKHDVLHACIEGNFGSGYEKGITITGICRWSCPDTNRRLHRAGFQIEGEGGEEAEIIIRLICSHSI